MVKAAENFIYGTQFFKEGEEIPPSLVPELEKHQCHVLETYIQIEGTWYKIQDPLIKGWVEKRKRHEKRLRKFFNVKPEKPDVIPPSSESNMLRSRPKSSTKEKELIEKSHQMGFEKFRDWAKKTHRVTGRSVRGIIKDILSGKKEI